MNEFQGLLIHILRTYPQNPEIRQNFKPFNLDFEKEKCQEIA